MKSGVDGWDRGCPGSSRRRRARRIARRTVGGAARGLGALAALALIGVLTAAVALGERTQYGDLVVSLDGRLAPLELPRERPAPVAIELGGTLSTTDGDALPRVTRIEFGLPGQGVLFSRGLPICPIRSLTDTTQAAALRHCRKALVGNGWIDAEVVLPNQTPFWIHAPVLAFNGRMHGRPAVLMHAISKSPPTVVVLPFVVRRRPGRFGMALIANLSSYLGPWPHFARFELRISRRFRNDGREHSYLSASCPIPPRFTAGFFSFAKATYTLANGRQVSTAIARSCRAR